MNPVDREPTGAGGERRPTLRSISIEGRQIGMGAPCYVIAEAGVNHNGDIALAERLIDAAADAGADAVKFQTFSPALLATGGAPKARYQTETTGSDGDQRSMLARLALRGDAWHHLQAHARRRRIAWFSTPFDEPSADLLAALEVPAYKISSGDLTNHLLLAHVAGLSGSTDRPILVSTGMATLAEVDAALEVLSEWGAPALALLHCVSQYPAEAADANLLAMATMERAFHVPVGFSDHTLGVEVAVAAVAAGARLLEKHITLDHALPGPDHRASLEPREFQSLVRGIRGVESWLGSGEKMPRPCEAEVALVARRSLHWQVAVAAGTRVRREHVIALRPGSGLPVVNLRRLFSRTVSRDVAAGALVVEEDLS